MNMLPTRYRPEDKSLNARFQRFRQIIEYSSVDYCALALSSFSAGTSLATYFAVTGNPINAAISMGAGMGMATVGMPILARNYDFKLLRDWAIATAAASAIAYAVPASSQEIPSKANHQTIVVSPS